MPPPQGDLRDFLARHALECATTVETWMTRSLPTAATLIEAVWPDPAWRDVLRHAVVWPVDEHAGPDPSASAFLAAATTERGLGVITLDGETAWWRAAAIGIPHPVLLPALDEFRGFATELGLEQGLHQLHRETWLKPQDTEVTVLHDFAGGRFAQLQEATNRARSFGYSMRSGYAIARMWEAGQRVEARYWLGSDVPINASITGTLEWVGDAGVALKLGELGDVAYSEGMRMAARIYAGRAPEETEA